MSPQSLVLVTGCTGYLGSHCVKALLDKGYRVRGTVRSLKNHQKLSPIRQLDPSGKNLELVEADLMKKEGWKEAVSGCDYVLHVASPLPMQSTQETIDTAVTGTKNVLEACANEPSIKKVVLTSSLTAVFGGCKSDKFHFTPEDWTVLDGTRNFYFKSKTLAEQEAWRFVKEGGHTNNFPLTVINPGFIMGPMITNEKGGSAEVIGMLMTLPILPRLRVGNIDVRDCALSHIAAMENRESDGKRVFCVEDKDYLMTELSAYLKKEFQDQGYCVSTRNLPNPIVNFLSLFSTQMSLLSEGLDKEFTFDTSILREVLNIQPRDTTQSAIDMAYDLIEKGHLKRTSEYRGRK